MKIKQTETTAMLAALVQFRAASLGDFSPCQSERRQEK